jgi:restriction endonuclease Mrr
MTIPTQPEIAGPLLQIYANNKIHSKSEMTNLVADYFNLNEAERKQLKSSGRETLISNRCGWSRYRLKKAGLLKILPDKSYKITSKGIEILKKNIFVLDYKTLSNLQKEVKIEK